MSYMQDPLRVSKNPSLRPYLSQHDNGAGVEGQEGAVLEAVLHQQATHERREGTHDGHSVRVSGYPRPEHDQEGIHRPDD